MVSGRPPEIPGVENIVGLFINSIPVRIRYSLDVKFNNLIKEVQKSYLDSESHHHISLADIQSQCFLKQNLIDHIIVFENYPIAEKIENLENEKLNLKISKVDLFEQTNYNLTISVTLSDILSVSFCYNSSLLDTEMMRRLKIHFENVINQIVSDSEIKISAFAINAKSVA